MKISLSNNGGFPPLILKNSKKLDNKERNISSNIKNNVNIRQILQTTKTENILDKVKESTELEEIKTL